MKYVIALPFHRNGELDWEYFNPEANDFIPMCVFDVSEAKKYKTREEAFAALPQAIEMLVADRITPSDGDRPWLGELIEKHIRTNARIVSVPSWLNRLWYWITRSPMPVESTAVTYHHN